MYSSGSGAATYCLDEMPRRKRPLPYNVFVLGMAMGLAAAKTAYPYAAGETCLHQHRTIGINLSASETILGTDPGRYALQVGRKMAQKEGLPLPLVYAVDEFKKVIDVRQVKVTYEQGSTKAMLSVFVWMPTYDYDKMMELAEVQQSVECAAQSRGYELDCIFLPVPHVDPDAVAAVDRMIYPV